jgi:hypothetical protein
LKTFKERTYKDIAALFIDPTTEKFDLKRHSLGDDLQQIIEDRKNFIGDSEGRGRNPSCD